MKNGQIEKGAGGEEEVRFGAPIEVDPGVALLQEIHRTAGHVAWLERKVRTMSEASLVWSKAAFEQEEVTGGPGGGSTAVRKRMDREVNTWWKIYEAERQHLARVSLAAIKAGIEERRVRLAEKSLTALEAAVLATIAQFGVDTGSARVREVLSANLEQILYSGMADALDPDALPMAEPVAPPKYGEGKQVIELPPPVEF